VPLPEDVINEDFTETVKVPNEDGSTPRKESVKRTANVNHHAILYIKVGQFEEEEEVPIDITSAKDKKEGEAAADKEGEEKEVKTELVTKLVDEDQQGKALSILGNGIPNLPN